MTERDKIKQALRAIPGVTLVTGGWPPSFDTLPCILLTLAGEGAADYRDDREYLTALAWYVRVFHAKEPPLLALADAAEKAMKSMGYVRQLRHEEPGDKMRQVVMRFAKTIITERD